MRAPDRVEVMERLRQIVAAFRATAAADPRFVPLVVGAALLGAAVPVVVLGLVLSQWIAGAVLGVLLGLLAGLVVFGRRATAAQIRAIEGQPGAAAAVLQTMRGQWFVTPAVAVTGKAAMVHRVVGRCGVVLVAEGPGAAPAQLVRKESQRLRRAVGAEVPVTTVVVGDGEGQVPLGRLALHLARLPRKLKRRKVADVARRLDALAGTRVPIPKGPLPRIPKRRLR